jgi:hypothetical protein
MQQQSRRRLLQAPNESGYIADHDCELRDTAHKMPHRSAQQLQQHAGRNEDIISSAGVQ